MSISLVIMAAGAGSRFGGLKQTAAVGPSGETVLDYSVYDALRAGFDEIVFIIRRAIEQDFRELLERFPRHVPIRMAFQELDSLVDDQYVEQARRAGRTKPWGTGHAVLCASEAVHGPFAVINSDDFYGERSFALVHEFLAARRPDSREWCMPGYLLRNTTSPHGHVSRGICTISADGTLLSIQEHTKIVERGGRFYSLASGTAPAAAAQDPGDKLGSIELSGDAIVSMNFWGLTPAFFEEAFAEFRKFLNNSAGDISAEFYLPEVIGSLVARKAARVSMLETPESWFGISYRKDVEAVRRHLQTLTASGFYPSPLWGA